MRRRIHHEDADHRERGGRHDQRRVQVSKRTAFERIELAGDEVHQSVTPPFVIVDCVRP
jgi:hypothetical protein